MLPTFFMFALSLSLSRYFMNLSERIPHLRQLPNVPTVLFRSRSKILAHACSPIFLLSPTRIFGSSETLISYTSPSSLCLFLPDPKFQSLRLEQGFLNIRGKKVKEA